LHKQIYPNASSIDCLLTACACTLQVDKATMGGQQVILCVAHTTAVRTSALKPLPI